MSIYRSALGGAPTDGADEVLVVGGTAIPLDGSSTPATVTVGSTTYNVSADNTGTVTFTPPSGEIATADAEALLNAIQYENLSDNPDTTDRTFDVTVDDGDVASNIATATITVVPINDPPGYRPRQ